MTQQGEKTTTGAATTRAEQALTSAGKQLGRFVGEATVRLRQATLALREEADQLDTPISTQQKRSQASVARHAQVSQPTMERAEALVTQLGQRVAYWTLGGNLSVQRTVARWREDAEDMWVEAREIHQGWQDKSEQREDGTD